MRSRPRRVLGVLLLASLTSLLACTTTSISTSTSGMRPPSARSLPANATAAGNPRRELEALLVLLADRRILEPLVVSRALESDVSMRRHLALTLGRVGDGAGAPALAALLTDAEPRVRRAAAFALGRLPAGDPAMVKRLLRAVHDADRETGIRATCALARRGVALDVVAGALNELGPDERLARLLPSLYRFRGAGVETWAQAGLAASAPALRRWAAYGLARAPQRAALGLLRPLLSDADPWIAGWAARALGRVGARSDLARLEPLLDRPEVGPVVQALRAARALIARGAAAPSPFWGDRLRRLLDDPRAGVRISAFEVAGSFLLDQALADRLAARVHDAGSPRARGLALVALAEGGDARAEALALEAAAAGDPAMRTRAAEAAGMLGADHLLRKLVVDPHAAVRAEALSVVLAVEDDPRAEPWARRALGDPDPGVRTVALEWAAEHPRISPPVLMAATAGSDRQGAAAMAAVQALGARALAVAQDREAVARALETLAGGRWFALRRAALAALATFDGEVPRAGPASHKPVATYRDVVAQTARPRWVEIETERGSFELRLDCREAPMTCLGFLQLVAQGYYDGLTWHRVVPDFVVQGGDPRGDGRGGPGYQLRDEPNLLRYQRGVIGMARAGPDTAGSQFFITLSAQPHLDGDYTAFGMVVRGMDVLDRLIQGDSIVRMVEIEAPREGH